MSGKTISTSDTKIEALSLQSSAYGVTIPLLYGVNRIAGNMIWYGGFKATPNTTSSSGKGGSVNTQNTTFVYSASVMMGLCEGQITGISRAWKGKKLYAGGVLPAQITTVSESFVVPGAGGAITVAHAATFSANIGVTLQNGDGGYTLSEGQDYTRVGGVYTFPVNSFLGPVAVNYQFTTAGATQTALSALGLSFASGTLGQSVWPYLTTAFPFQAVGYSGLALVYAQDYALGTGAQVDNHTFEIQGPQAYSVSAVIPDANPATVTWDVLINGRYGAAFPSAQLGSPDLWSTYCLASGILMSPALTEQMQAGEFVALMGKLTNTAPVWSSGKLKMLPYGDAPLGNNGATYTPNVTPAYDLGDDNFISKGGDPIRVIRKPQADAFNHVRIEFCNRANLYNIEIAEAKDSANIDIYGLRSAPMLAAHWICDGSAARTVAQLLLQRALYVRNRYEFTLPWTKALLEPMELVTLTDAGLGLNKLPARIVEISEDEAGDLSVIAEEFPLGVATAALYPMQTGAGFQHDYSAAPGPVSPPVIFEAPGALTANGLELYVAAAGAGAAWGGCHVWVSLDGVSYKQVGTLNGPSRYGTLNGPPSGGFVHVKLVAGALTSGSTADALALNTLCFIGGASREYFTYAAATLTAALSYDLTYVSTGVYGSQVGGHSTGDPFVRVDSAIAKSGPIDLGYVGKTVHVKCTSFNIYGASEESLAAVVDYTYVITGAQVLGNAGASAFQGIANATSDNILSQGEKPPIILDYANILADQSGIDAQALAYAVSSVAYDTAVTALTAYLNSLTAPVAWNNLTGTTAFVGTAFRSNFANVYAARQALLNATAAAAGTRATWAGVVNAPLDTSNMVQTPSFEGGSLRQWNGAGVFAVTGQAWAKALYTQQRDTTETGTLIPVRAGETIFAACDMLPSTVNACGFGFFSYAADGATITGFQLVCSLAAGAGWTRISGSVQVVAGTAFIRPWLQIGAFGTFGTLYATNLYLGRSAPGATVGATWGSNLTGQPADSALLNALQQWAQVSGAGKPSDNATVGATWGSNLTGQPADSALLNALQQWAQVSGAGKPADYATAGKSLGLPLANWATLAGNVFVTLTDGYSGSSALRMAQPNGYPNQGNFTPIDPSKTYRTRFWARSIAATNGLLYFSLRQFVDAAGATAGPTNNGRSPYKPSGASRTTATDSWTEYSYLWSSSDWQTGVKYVQPEFLGNYNGTAGYWEVQDFTFEEVTEVLNAGTIANWSGVANNDGNRPANGATVGATWGGNLTGQPADAALLNSLQQWAQVNGAGKPSDNATVGATWGSNLTGQPADSALLNALQQWAQVSGAGKPSDNATVGATWGSNLTGQPADAALLNSLQQWAQVSGSGRPADNATAGKSLGLPLANWANLGGNSFVTLTDGHSGSSALRMAQPNGYPNQGNFTPIDPSKTYRTRFWARSVAATNGLLYFSLRQFIDAAGATAGPTNNGRSPYKPSGAPRSLATDSWTEYSYLWGAADWQAGVQYVQPEFLGNYIGTAGYWEVQDFTFEEVTEVLNSGTIANWSGVANNDGNRPANGATKNVVSYQAAAPTSPTNGDLWYSISTGSWETFVAGVWQIVSDVTATKVAAGIAGQGALATLNTADWGTQVLGAGKPVNNATAGATLGIDVGGQITSGNSGALVGPGAIGTTHIANLAVDTLQIAGNAVTVPSFSVSAAAVNASGFSWVTILTSPIVSIGAGTVCINIALSSAPAVDGFDINGSPIYAPMLYRLLSNGNIAASWSGYKVIADLAYSLSDTPNVAVTYQLQHNANSNATGGAGSTGRRTMLCLGVKK